MCSDCMHKQNKECEEEKLSSFLGGLFLLKRTVSNAEFLDFLNRFQEMYNLYILDDNLCVKVEIKNDSVTLINEYDDIIIYNHKEMSVREYLYVISSSRIKEFFGIAQSRNLVCNLYSTIKRKLLKKVNI